MSNELYWLMKTEPETFSFEDLLKRPKQTESWEGVRNYTARNFMRDQFKIGQSVFIYHSRV
ncbi:MAG: EVE domain-containing protein, partial [Proteobacteria bacterium]